MTILSLSIPPNTTFFNQVSFECFSQFFCCNFLNDLFIYILNFTMIRETTILTEF